MANALLDPPMADNLNLFDESFHYKGALEIYLAYDYLPVRNFMSLSKNINELYELVYYLLNEQRVPASEILIFEHVATGHSIEAVIKVLEKVGVSRNAYIALAFVLIIITAVVTVDNHNQARADLQHTLIETVKSKSDIEKNNSGIEKDKAEAKKALAEAKKAEAEAYSIKLDAILRGKKFKQDSIDRILKHKESPKIFKKKKAIDKSIKQSPINLTVINGNVIHGDNNTLLE